MRKWQIEGFFSGQEAGLQRQPLATFPLLVGRDKNVALSIVSGEVSRHHAQFDQIVDQLFLTDLNSTNGTFINRQRIRDRIEVQHGDVIHFAHHEFRVLALEEEDLDNDKTCFNQLSLAGNIPSGLQQLQTMLQARAVTAVYQPIVKLDGTLYGYEVLGRGKSDDIGKTPYELFRVAESVSGNAAQLSRVMRDCGVESISHLQPDCRFFLNTHPEELRNPDGLLLSLTQLRNNYPHIKLVLEIHEDAIADITAMKAFAIALKQIGIELAYDDFGAGQSRLMELIDVPADYVKFDIALIRGLHEAPESKQKMVAALAAMTKAMGIGILAEGVECEAELQMCRDMQFDLIQGYFFSKPLQELTYSNPLI